MPRCSVSRTVSSAPARKPIVPCPVESTKNLPANRRALARARIQRDDRADVRRVGISTAMTWLLRKSEMFFSARTMLSFFSSPNSSAVPGRALRVIDELLHDLAEIRIEPAPDAAHRPDAHLGGAIAAEHRAILDQRHLAPHARRGDRRAEPRIAAAGHHQIVLARLDRLLRQAERGAPPRRERLRLVRRRLRAFGAK